jgi:hypothetical protein
LTGSVSRSKEVQTVREASTPAPAFGAQQSNDDITQRWEVTVTRYENQALNAVRTRRFRAGIL